jgi:hypothetical protein
MGKVPIHLAQVPGPDAKCGGAPNINTDTIAQDSEARRTIMIGCAAHRGGGAADTPPGGNTKSYTETKARLNVSTLHNEGS